MKTDSMLCVLFTTLMFTGVVLLYLSGEDDLIGVVVGMGAVILGVLGLEAQSIQQSITELREAK